MHFFAQVLKIPTIGYGPGGLDYHAVDERARVQDLVNANITSEMFRSRYADVFAVAHDVEHFSSRDVGVLTFTEEHELFRTTVRDVVRNEIDPHCDEWDEAGYPRELHREARAAPRRSSAPRPR